MPATRRALVTIQANGEGDLQAAADELVELLGAFSGARCRVAFATAKEPVVEVSSE